MKSKPLNLNGNTPAYSTIISNLETRYKNLEGLSEREFFIGIADYMKYIEDTPEFTPIIESIQQERVRLEQEDYQLQQILYKDMRNVVSEVLGAIKKKNITFPQLDEAIREYNLMHSIEDLEDIISALYNNGYQELVDHFVIVTKDKKTILDFKISDSYLPCMKVREALSRGYRTALWGALRELYDVWGTVNSIDRFESYLIRGRMLTKKDYQNNLFRVHRHIIEKLSLKVKSESDLIKIDKTKKSSNNISRFGGLWLELEIGRGGFRDKSHRFNPSEAPYKILRLLLEKKNDLHNKNGEVIREEFMKATGIKNWEVIKQIVRGMRRNLGVSRKTNPNLDPFQDTGNGYKLIEPLEEIKHP